MVDRPQLDVLLHESIQRDLGGRILLIQLVGLGVGRFCGGGERGDQRCGLELLEDPGLPRRALVKGLLGNSILRRPAAQRM